MKNNTIFEFKPFSDKQKKVQTWWIPGVSPYANHDMIITDGSVRSGKTIADIDGFFNWSLMSFEHQKFILAGKTMGALKRNVIDPAIGILNAKGIPFDYVRSSDESHLRVGTNRYYLFGANNEASQNALQGLTAAGGLADEAALFPWNFVQQMIARCSVEDSKLWLNCNPEGPNHPIKKELIDQAKAKRILRLHFTMEDNLTLSPKVRAKYERMYTGLWKKRMIDGLWVMAEGVIYDMFDEERHVIKDQNRIEAITRNAKEWYISCDYGTGTVFVLGLFCIYKGIRYLVRSFYWDAHEQMRQKADSEYCADLLKLKGNTMVDWIIIPDDALSFIAELRKRNIGPIRVYKRDPGTVLRGIRMMSNLITDGKYFILAHPSNQPIIDEYSAYLWDQKAQERGEDAPLKQNDHGKDMERYFHDTVSRIHKVGLKPSGY